MTLEECELRFVDPPRADVVVPLWHATASRTAELDGDGIASLRICDVAAPSLDLARAYVTWARDVGYTIIDAFPRGDRLPADVPDSWPDGMVGHGWSLSLWLRQGAGYMLTIASSVLGVPGDPSLIFNLSRIAPSVADE